MALSSCDLMLASGFLPSGILKVGQVNSARFPSLSLRSKNHEGELLNASSQRSKRNLQISAQYDGRRGGGAGDFMAGFMLGGLVFGGLGCLFAPQISKTLFPSKDREPLYNSNIIDDDEGIAKTRRNLNEKIAKLNAAIDNVAAQLKTDNGYAFDKDGVAELESAA